MPGGTLRHGEVEYRRASVSGGVGGFLGGAGLGLGFEGSWMEGFGRIKNLDAWWFVLSIAKESRKILIYRWRSKKDSEVNNADDKTNVKTGLVLTAILPCLY